jgi:uncharacterized protein YggE
MRGFVIALVIVFSAAGRADAQAPRPQALERHITVVGEGTANVVPDLAVIQAGVTTQGKTAREASESNTDTMANVLAALKANGIAERDTQTSQFSIRPVYDTRREGENRIVGFQATNQISVRVRALAKIAAVLDRMIAAGANHVSGIDFTVSERSRLLDNARGQAVTDARRKAELLARAAGVRLGRAIVIAEDSEAPRPMERMTMRAAPAAAVPIEAGEQALRVHVSVTFELMP